MEIQYATAHLGDPGFEPTDVRLQILLDMYRCLGGMAIHDNRENQTEAIRVVSGLVRGMLVALAATESEGA